MERLDTTMMTLQESVLSNLGQSTGLMFMARGAILPEARQMFSRMARSQLRQAVVGLHTLSLLGTYRVDSYQRVFGCKAGE